MAGFSSDFDKWAGKPQDKSQTSRGEEKCEGTITKQFPNADKTQFDVQTSANEKYNITAEIFFNEGPGSSLSVFGSENMGAS